MKLLGKVLFLASLIKMCISVEIYCHHQRNAWTSLGPLQECIVENLVITQPNDTVTRLNKHNYLTVKSFFIHKSQKCDFMPVGIEKFLERLEVLIIAGTALTTITKENLKPFTFLTQLYMNDNRLQALDGDLFIHNPSITGVNFDSNFIKRIGFFLLEPLNSLKWITFSYNSCLNSKAHNSSQLVMLKEELRKKCPMPNETVTSSPPPDAAPLIDCNAIQKIADLEARIVELEVALNKSTSELIATTSDFCVRFSDWGNEKCFGVDTTSTTMHPDDQTEGFVMSVEN